MKRDEFDSQLNSLLLSAEKLIPEKDLPDFKNTAYEVCWCTFAYSYLDSAPFGYSFAAKKPHCE